MKQYLFDTNSVSLTFYNSLPEKWKRYWKEVRMGKCGLLLIEPLISEIYYKNIPKLGKKKSKDHIFWLKSLPQTKIHQLDDNDAIKAGDIKVQYSRYKLSLVDCFILSVAKDHNAVVFTTDYQMKYVSSKIKVNVNFLPLFK